MPSRAAWILSRLGLGPARLLGYTWVTITPRALLPRLLMKPPEALLDSVTICAAEPAARSALLPSTTAEPEAIISTAWASALATLAATGAKSGLARPNFSSNTGVKVG